ncbi:hypothetical protein Thivi_4568 [Thiocystis violascens DSM 198]|uniref:Uncharacterized protein n=1 Tax=Thiocystis violascens (strain ATCC 17096 / DSM 198 / 6111) TaxID=765911 RepID=I3YH93_THIV6|nr:hypothetical protein Thivi_4568 [Thiocystis violascens DSM 198]
MGDAEQRLREWPVAGKLWLGITAMLFLFVIAGTPGPSGTPSRASLEAETAARPEAPGTLIPDLSTDPAAPGDSLVMPGEAGVDSAEQLDAAPVLETAGADLASAPDVSEDANADAASDGGESFDMADEAEPDPARSGDIPLCDPAAPFVFASRTDPADTIALERCVRETETGTPHLLESLPLTNRLVRLVQRSLKVAPLAVLLFPEITSLKPFMVPLKPFVVSLKPFVVRFSNHEGLHAPRPSVSRAS